MTHENYRELITASALTALDVADARDLKAHLETCVECRAEASEWDSTAALLAFEAQPLEPSTRVLELILSEARAQGRHAAGATVVPFERARKNKLSAASYAIAASIALLAIAIALFGFWGHENNAELARLSEENSGLKKELARERDIVALMTSPGARMAELAGTNVAPGAHAMIAYDKNGHAMLMAKGLPAAPAGKAYQLWYIMGSKPMPGKVFATDTNGNGSLQDQVPIEAMSGAVFAITLEPATGVQSPTGAIYLKSGA